MTWLVVPMQHASYMKRIIELRLGLVSSCSSEKSRNIILLGYCLRFLWIKKIVVVQKKKNIVGLSLCFQAINEITNRCDELIILNNLS